MLNLDLEAGRFFSPSEDEHAAAVAVIGADVKDELFPNIDPIGRTITFAAIPCASSACRSARAGCSARHATT